MKRIYLITLITILALSTFPSFGQKKPSSDWKWIRVYASNGRSVEAPSHWESSEAVRNGVLQLVFTSKGGGASMAMFFFEGENQSAGERMSMMINHNNIDVIESSTETYGSLLVQTKKGKMKYNGTTFKVLLSTADGAGGKFNVVGAMWGPDEAFQDHKAKFERFFMSLQ